MKQLGKAFPDNLAWGRTRRVHRQDDEYGDSPRRAGRLYVLITVFLVTFVILEARLFHLTITKGAANRLRSEDNRVREEIIPAPRGIIFDRTGTPLVRNVPFYREVTKNCHGSGEDCETRIDPDEARRRLAKGTAETLMFRIGREYLFGEKAAHITGYIGEISEEEQKKTPHRAGDLVGRGGIEEQYEEYLRGIDGKELVEVDAHGEKLRTIGKVPEIPGNNLTLAIDAKLQDLSATLIASRSGAIVVTVPKTGEVLALVSNPSFDPNFFTTSDERVTDILTSGSRPLFNRAISGSYPPGSTFKMVTGTAALEEHALTAQTKIEDTGVITIGQYKFHNWYFTQHGKTDGSVDMVRAIARSNDIYFYKAGESVGEDKLSLWAKKFGLGSLTGIDLPGEASGLVPDKNWKLSTSGEPWYLGDTYHYAIGQGSLLTTPLQVAMMTSVVAGSGRFCTPTLAKTHDSTRKKSNCREVGIHPETVETIHEGMKQACSPGGTGWPLFKFKIKNEKIKIDGENFLATFESTTSAKPIVEIPIACKTGTAEYGDPKGRTHAWFTAFAPVKDPEIVVTVLVEGGGEGSSVAGPIAKKILEYWFSR